MLIAHVSDFHAVGTGLLFKDKFDTRLALTRLVDRLRALTPRPDCLVVSGDLGEDATADEYAHVGEALATLDLPIIAVPGNHDQRAPLVAAMPRLFTPTTDGFLCHRTELGGVTFVALDTLVEGSGHGALCDRRLSWLNDALAHTNGRPTVLVLHHPPITTGMTSMDAIGLTDGKAEFAKILQAHRGVELILCGHVHRAIQGTFEGIPVRIGPSSSHQIACDLTPGAPFQFVAEPPQFLLHLRDASGATVTHTLYVDDF